MREIGREGQLSLVYTEVVRASERARERKKERGTERAIKTEGQR